MLTFQLPLVGRSLEIQNISKEIEKLTQTSTPVLISGESGTGKELIARTLHENSVRATFPFVEAQSGNLSPDQLLQFEGARGGTIFFDEVGNLSYSNQASLLKILQSQTFDSIRIITATCKNLADAVEKHEFQKDLYDFLSENTIKISSLRERKEDILPLVSHFIQKTNQTMGYTIEPVSDQVLAALTAHDWPGNVRELENLIERLVILKGQGSLVLEDLPHRVFQKYAETQSSGTGAVSDWEFPKMALPHSGLDLKAIVSAFENHLVDQALSRTNGNKNRASELLSMNRTTLVEKLRKRGMIVPLSARTEQSERIERIEHIEKDESETP